MKLLFLLLVPISLFGQTKPIDGVFGVKFGSSKLAAQTIIKAKGGVPTTIRRIGTTDNLSYNNLKLGGRKTVTVNFQFFNDKLYSISVYLIPEKEPLALNLYYEILGDLKTVYGISKKERIFNTPYREGDGNEIAALMEGYATISDVWMDQVKKTAIKLTIDDLPMIKINYQDSKLFLESRNGHGALKDY